FAGDLIKGVRDMGASGDINLTNAGNINIVTLNEVIQGPANVTVTATGVAANILAASNNGVATPPFVGSIVSTGGTATATAGQDLLAGNPGTSSVGNIFGGGSLVLTAGRDITIDTDSFIEAHGAGIVTLQQATTTTRNIDLGGGPTPGDLGLSDVELGQVTAGVLRIGRLDNAGSITVTAPVTTHAGYNTLDLLTGSTISQAPA